MIVTCILDLQLQIKKNNEFHGVTLMVWYPLEQVPETMSRGHATMLSHLDASVEKLRTKHIRIMNLGQS